MKKVLLIFGSLAFIQFLSRAQQSQDSLREKVSKTTIELVYNQYIQDGNNSAVTGGIGTEELTVYGPKLSIASSFGNHALTVNLGSDIISSASTDRIDHIPSTASVLDARSYANFSYGIKTKSDLKLSAGSGFSIESDYFSIGYLAGIEKKSKNGMRNFSAKLQVFTDDLRWGRFQAKFDYKPVRLIYPSELRYKEWYDEYRRNSYNLKLGYDQILNKRNRLGISSDVVYQHGLLATPFHRIFFTDGTQGVEQLPNQRYKIGVSSKLNTFVKGQVILRNSVNVYADNFGILAASIGNETVIKLKPTILLIPHVRFYSQTGSPYFAPYGEHESTEQYYTSDYDYSAIRTLTIGTGFKYKPNWRLGKKTSFNSVQLKYSYMIRSNGLQAHVLSSLFDLSFTNRKQVPVKRKDQK